MPRKKIWPDELAETKYIASSMALICWQIAYGGFGIGVDSRLAERCREWSDKWDIDRMRIDNLEKGAAS